MIYILFFSVVAIAIIDFIIYRDVLSPLFLASIMFMISIWINILNVYRWGTEYSPKTILIIVSGLLAIGGGGVIVNLFYSHRRRPNKNIICQYNLIQVETAKYVFLLAIQVMILIWDFYATKGQAGLATSIDGMLSSARHVAMTTGTGKGIVSRLIGINKAIAYYYIYVLIYNRVICKQDKLKIAYFLPILIYVSDIFLSTGRTELIRILSYTFILFITMYIGEKRVKIKQLFKIFLVGVFVLSVFFVAFTLIGRLLGKGIYNTASDVFQIYMGSSIYLLNQYVISPGTSTNEFFGEHTLYGIYNILSYIVPGIEHTMNPALEFRYIPSWNSNIYTAFRRYYQDFDFVGMIIVCILLGIFYYVLREKSKMEKRYGWYVIFYAVSIFPIIEIAIEERFFMTYLSFSNMLDVFFLWLIYKFVTRTKLKLHSRKIINSNKF